MMRALASAALLALPLPAGAMGSIGLGRGLGLGHQEPQWTPRRLNAPLWFRADLGITLNGATVSAWANQGTDAAGSLAQGVAANQPTYTAVSSLGSRPALSFDTVNDVLTGSSANLAQPNFIALAVRTAADVTTGNRGVVDGAIARHYVFAQDGSWKVFAGTVAVVGAAANSANYALQCRVNGAASNARLNGSAWSGVLAVGPTALQSFQVSLVWGGPVGEIIVLDTMPSALIEDRIHAYMRVRYGLW